MYKLLELKEKYRILYSKYSMYIDAAFKFMVALVTMILINVNIGTMEILNNPLVVIIIALVCALLPKTLSVIILVLVMLGHMFAIAMEPAAAVAVMFVIMYLLFFRFTPGDSYVLVLMPLFSMLNIPYIIPIILGLIATPVSVISVAFGTLIYFIISFVGTNYDVVVNVASEDGFKALSMFAEGVLKNGTLYYSIAVFSIVLILVYILRRRAIDYSWIIAVCAGGIVEIVMFIIGNVMFDMSLISSFTSSILGGIICVGAAWFLQFFIHSVDYVRAEKVQFEDDDYYYYVKAVPKIKVASPDVRVKRVKVKSNPDKK